jgi:regulator of ribonuclease activity A
MTFKTADLYDANPTEVRIADPGFNHYGGRKRFVGQITTLLVYEDNVLVHELLKQPGEGKVIVIDGGGSLRNAIVGDILAQRAKDQGYAGFVINGAARDISTTANIDIGLMAMGVNPTKPKKNGFGERGKPLRFAGVTFTPGEWLYADEDGILLCARKLT